MSEKNKSSAGCMLIIAIALVIAAVTFMNIKNGSGKDHIDCIEQRAGQHASVADKAQAGQICRNQGR